MDSDTKQTSMLEDTITGLVEVFINQQSRCKNCGNEGGVFVCDDCQEDVEKLHSMIIDMMDVMQVEPADKLYLSMSLVIGPLSYLSAELLLPFDMAYKVCPDCAAFNAECTKHENKTDYITQGGKPSEGVLYSFVCHDCDYEWDEFYPY